MFFKWRQMRIVYITGFNRKVQTFFSEVHIIYIYYYYACQCVDVNACREVILCHGLCQGDQVCDCMRKFLKIGYNLVRFGEGLYFDQISS